MNIVISSYFRSKSIKKAVTLRRKINLIHYVHILIGWSCVFHPHTVCGRARYISITNFPHNAGFLGLDSEETLVFFEV